MKTKKFTFIFLLLLILSISFVTMIDSMLMNLLIVTVIGLMILLVINNMNLEKVILMTFFFSIPFFRDYDFTSMNDYHVITKPYYTFNLVQLFALIFLILILKNRKKIKVGIDLIILFIFNVICFTSTIYAKNPPAAFFDALRIFTITIIYIYFSRIFNYKKYKGLAINIMVLTVVFQLIIGIIQIIINGPIGLGILGESKEVFRAGVSGFEKGMSGTFGHPGPFALYSLMILSFIMFDNCINKTVKNIGITICTLNILISAGRTAMILMALIFIIYYINSLKEINIKKIHRLIMIGLFGIIMCAILSDEILMVFNRFLNSDTSDQLGNRLYHYEIAFKYIKEKPLLGWGLNNYLDLSYSDHPIRFYTNFFFNNPIHNAYLLYAIEIGILGSLLFILFLVINFKWYKKNSRYLDINTNNICKGYIVGIIIYSIYNFQGWGGVQTRSLVLVILINAFLYNVNSLIAKE